MSEVYRGIDVVYYGNERQLEYDFVVRPGGDPRQIRLRYEGVDRFEIDASGDLVLHVAGGELRQRLPVIYQEVNGSRQRVGGAYRRLGRRDFAFDVDPYDASRPLIIDPVLLYSTYLGGSGLDFASAIAVDSSGSAYIAGFTSSVNFPTANALQGTSGGSNDAFVTKLNASGSALVYSTYLGGSDTDGAGAIAVDASGNVSVIGGTSSGNFPIVNALQASYSGSGDAFVTKLNSSGSALIYSTYLGGSNSEGGLGIVLDASGSAYVAGQTLSSNFPTANALQASSNGGSEGFVAKLNPSGSALVYSTYLGGTASERCTGIAVDSSGSAYVTGPTTSFNFPTVNAFQTINSGIEDGFVTKLNPSGSALVYSTYLGGTVSDQPAAIAVDTSGHAYVTGITFSSNYPTASPFQPSRGGGLYDAFVTKLSSSGNALVYSTYLGGSFEDGATGIAVDGTGNAYVVGATPSLNFPIVDPVQPRGAGFEVFVTKLNPSGSGLIYSTWLGGSGHDLGSAIAIGIGGTVYVTGQTQSPDFPTLGPVQASNGGFTDAFVAALLEELPDMTVAKSHSGNFQQGQTGTFTIVATNIGTASSSGIVTVTDTVPAGLTATAISGTGWTCTLATVTCTRSDALPSGASYPPITLTVNVSLTATGTVTNTAAVSGGGEDNAANNTASDVAAVLPGSDIPALDPRTLAVLGLLLATAGIVALRRS